MRRLGPCEGARIESVRDHLTQLPGFARRHLLRGAEVLGRGADDRIGIAHEGIEEGAVERQRGALLDDVAVPGNHPLDRARQ